LLEINTVVQLLQIEFHTLTSVSQITLPNGDGNLDEWAPGCTNNYPDLSFSIFDRYGRVIAKYRLGQKWDGKYKGGITSGDYWYTLKLNNRRS
jgi:gliding motility-associated-like protein